MALTTSSSTQLGCGRDIDQVWDHLDRAPDAHELTCPYCRTTRTDLAGLAEATEQLRRAHETDPDQQPSPALLDRILAVARSEVRRGRRLPLDEPTVDGTTPNTVSEQAVTAVIRRVGDRTTQIQIRRCTITSPTNDASGNPPATPVTQPSTTAPADPTHDGGTPPRWSNTSGLRAATVAVTLRVSAAHDLPITQASSQLRADIIAAVAREVGLDVTRVDVHIEDLHDA